MKCNRVGQGQANRLSHHSSSSLPKWDISNWTRKRTRPRSLGLPGLCLCPFPAASPPLTQSLPSKRRDFLRCPETPKRKFDDPEDGSVKSGTRPQERRLAALAEAFPSKGTLDSLRARPRNSPCCPAHHPGPRSHPRLHGGGSRDPGTIRAGRPEGDGSCCGAPDRARSGGQAVKRRSTRHQRGVWRDRALPIPAGLSGDRRRHPAGGVGGDSGGEGGDHLRPLSQHVLGRRRVSSLSVVVRHELTVRVLFA
jgi:hypothetical protein